MPLSWGVLPGKVANVGRGHVTSSDSLYLIDNSRKLTDLLPEKHATEEHKQIEGATDFDSGR